MAAAVAALLVAGLEWVLLVALDRDVFSSTGQMLVLLPAALGNQLPYALLASVALTAADAGLRTLALRKMRRPDLAVGGVVALLSAPYAMWLADSLFSGARISGVAHRSLWVVGASVVVALAFGAAGWLAVLRVTWRRGSGPLSALLVAGCAATLWASCTLFPDTYRDAHAFLGVWSILLAAMAAREVTAPAAGRLARGGVRGITLAAAALVASSFGGSVLLARDDAYAALVWRETASSRYVTWRWRFLARSRGPSGSGPSMVVKPVLETERTDALRRKRTAGVAPNIVLFNIDGLRRDRVGAHGYQRHPTTPNIDRFAARGVKFLNAYSSHPATPAFNSSLLLGRYLTVLKKEQQPPAFRGEAITRLLDRRGYHSFVKSWFELSRKTTFDPELYAIDTYVPKSTNKSDLETTLEELLPRLEAHLAEADALAAPVFVWLHLLGTHAVPGEAFVPDPAFPFGDTESDHYDSAVAGSDRWLPAIERAIEARRDGGRPTLWILSSDHGTHIGRAISRDLRDPVVRVPLVVVAPGVAPRSEEAPVDVALDLAATVLDFAGVRPPASYDGVSLVPLLLGETSDAMKDRLVPLAYHDARGAVYRGFKVIEDRNALLLYDRDADPGERRNLVGERADLADALIEATEVELARRKEATRAGAPSRSGR